MSIRNLTFGVWIVAASTAIYWGSRLLAAESIPDLEPVQSIDTDIVRSDLGRLLGSSVPASTTTSSPPVGSRLELLGVISGRESEGVALIAIDGKPPVVVRVGSRVHASAVLRSVDSRSATLATGDGGPPVVMRLASAHGAPAIEPPAPTEPRATAQQRFQQLQQRQFEEEELQNRAPEP